MRDRLAHRGPDGAGIWDGDNVILAHRRLAVLDPTPAGAQPMTSADGRWVVVYNGELYDDLAWRQRLLDEGHVRGFRSSCDTETLVEAIAAFGIEVLAEVRGMFAVAALDRREQRLHLARDPLGVKPLVWWCDGIEFAAASEPTALLEHPAIQAHPDLVGISNYLGSLRTTIGQRTLFEGIQTVLPGERIAVDLDRSALVARRFDAPPSPPVDPTIGAREAAERLFSVLDDSVAAQLRSDVPVCALLSGGLDSAAIVELSRHRTERLRTYVAGADSLDDDLVHARELADLWSLEHSEARLDRQAFLHGWGELIDRSGLPLTTPNEVAIRAVSRRLAADGCVVTLSGEGADELLGGYGDVMEAARSFERMRPADVSSAGFHLTTAAWIASPRKAELFRPELTRTLENDGEIIEHTHDALTSCGIEAGVDAHPLDAHLRYLRRVNLTALLERLDRATQQASVEGRVPFADQRVTALCESLPLPTKFGRPSGLSGGVGVVTRSRTKIVLRDALAPRLPDSVMNRAKASFPLPFQEWMSGGGAALRASDFAQALFMPGAIDRAASDPAGNWGTFWPMANLARWGDRWFA